MARVLSRAVPVTRPMARPLQLRVEVRQFDVIWISLERFSELSHP